MWCLRLVRGFQQKQRKAGVSVNEERKRKEERKNHKCRL